jgi:hypothetical protein
MLTKSFYNYVVHHIGSRRNPECTAFIIKVHYKHNNLNHIEILDKICKALFHSDACFYTYTESLE